MVPGGILGKRAHQEITASIQSPSENNSDHPEPTRKEQHPSRACEEITMTIQGPPGNNSNHPEPIKGNGNALALTCEGPLGRAHMQTKWTKHTGLTPLLRP